ncbi:hypothetical protein RFI_29228 [Reticulomyxa filosa]|uniref:Uncharacterized protein n=1 Tax=Reticulomyxa filosa TaxID=46433 RepID=X6M3W5_RETFI|nr:hypothetical protein RFI_29228 [Reticulomyxa filosa]|eukprot:ETO08162.1 hypothetical protein RFI_29228 [Reticulomyxa filosa]
MYSQEDKYKWIKIVSCSNDSTIRLWDAISGKPLHVLRGHSNSIRSAQFSPDGSKIVSYSFDKTVRIWDVSSGQQIQIQTDYPGDVDAIKFSSDSSTIIPYKENSIAQHLSDEKLIQVTQGHAGVTFEMQLSADGSKIVSSSGDRTIRLYDATGLEIRCIWQAGIQRYGLLMKWSVWKGVKGLSHQQKLLNAKKKKILYLQQNAKKKS